MNYFWWYEFSGKTKGRRPKYLNQFKGYQFEPFPLKATHDFSNQFPLHTIWLYGNKGALLYTSPAWKQEGNATNMKEEPTSAWKEPQTT